ncbi:hypothetical protein G4228_016965 [Cervus hanglu yarkandensis]|nr:hypothetical protein G4228_016965 [Cervus hanglu yarkandensis]
MNDSKQQSLFFITLPDLHKLCAVKIILNNGVADSEIRSRQMKICSMKMGRMISILHSIPPDCPFHSYEDFQMHWDGLENKVKLPNLTAGQRFTSAPAPAPSPGPARAPSFPPCSAAAGHKGAPSASRPKPAGSSALRLQPESVQSSKKPLSDQAAMVLGVPTPNRGSAQVQDTDFSPQHNIAPKFIPVFKSRPLQMNKSILPAENLRRKRVDTESKLFSLKSSEIQDDKPNLDPTAKKRHHSIQVKAKNVNLKTCRSRQEKNTESHGNMTKSPLSSGRSLIMSSSENKQLSNSSVFQMPTSNLGVIKSAVGSQVNGKENLTSKYITQTLGKSHESLKVKSQPHIFESDTDPEDSQPLESIDQTKESDVTDHRLTVSRTAPRSKKKLCQDSPKTSKKPHSNTVLCGQSRASRKQIHHLDGSKPRKSLIPKA